MVDGSFSYSFKPGEKGEWRVEARRAGNETYGAVASPPASFAVEEQFSTMFIILGAAVIVAGLAAWLLTGGRGGKREDSGRLLNPAGASGYTRDGLKA